MDISFRAGSVPRSLAELARTIVSDPRSASLVVTGIAPATAGPDVIDLVERGGTPTFPCRPSSRLVGAVGATARLTVEDGRAHPATVSVLLTGRLVMATTWHPCPDVRVLVALAISAVMVEYDGPLSPTVVRREIPVEAYRDFEPDPLVARSTTLTHSQQRDRREYAAAVADG